MCVHRRLGVYMCVCACLCTHVPVCLCRFGGSGYEFVCALEFAGIHTGGRQRDVSMKAGRRPDPYPMEFGYKFLLLCRYGGSLHKVKLNGSQGAQ